MHYLKSDLLVDVRIAFSSVYIKLYTFVREFSVLLEGLFSMKPLVSRFIPCNGTRFIRILFCWSFPLVLCQM